MKTDEKYEMISLNEEKVALDRKTYRGELYDDNGDYVGNIYKTNLGYKVYRLKECGRGERVAEIWRTFSGADFKFYKSLDLGYAVVKQYQLKD